MRHSNFRFLCKTNWYCRYVWDLIFNKFLVISLIKHFNFRRSGPSSFRYVTVFLSIFLKLYTSIWGYCGSVAQMFNATKCNGCGFDLHSGDEIFNILIFRPSNEAKHRVDLRHSTRDALRVWWNIGNGRDWSILILGS